jgi:hypothetical protein
MLDPSFPRLDDMLTMCSCCKRALLEPFGWLEIKDAAVRLHLLEKGRAPKVRQPICLCSMIAASATSGHRTVANRNFEH